MTNVAGRTPELSSGGDVSRRNPTTFVAAPPTFDDWTFLGLTMNMAREHFQWHPEPRPRLEKAL
jgi:hypothetical protein